MTKHEAPAGNYRIIKGSIGQSIQLPQNACRLNCSDLLHSDNVSDMASLDFFGGPGYHFVTDILDPNGDLQGQPACCINPSGNPHSIGGLAQNDIDPNIWIEVDSFAKSFYASIMADLGQVSTDNILANGALLESFTSNITNMTNNGTSVETFWLKAGPARQSYNEIKDITGPLQINPSVIYAQYFCQVPVLKSGGSLFLAILVADLVFLQALWKILNWITLAWLEYSDPCANVCGGCSKPDRELELLPMNTEAATNDMPVPEGRPPLLDRKTKHNPVESPQQHLLSPIADIDS